MKQSITLLAAAALLAVSPSCDKARKRQERQEALRDLQQSRREIANDIKMTDDGIEVDFDAVERHRKNIETAADKMGGKEGQALKIVAGFQAEINELGMKHSKATEDFAETINWQSLDKSRDYEARRKVLNDYIALNETIIGKYGGLHQGVMAKLDTIGFSGQERSAFDKEFLKNRRKITDLVRTIRQSDIECTRTAIGIIDRLEKLGDDWSWNEDDGILEFTRNEDADWFKARMEDFQKIGERQIKAQQEFMDMMKGK